ncbi:MAG: hypothetical protein WBP22_04925 [Candidatus Saccharimonas sp.]
MTERPHYRSDNHLKKPKVIINLDPSGSLTPQERWQRQYAFEAHTNMGRAALGCGTEQWGDAPSLKEYSEIFLPDDFPEPEFPQD